MALTKFCRCGKQIAITDKCCSECILYYQNKNAKYQKTYDKTKRENESFYHSDEWIRIRVLIISTYIGLDLYEYFINNRIVKADTVHHIIELKEDYSKGLDINNLIPLSASSHRKIHKMYLKRKKETQDMLFDILKRAKLNI